VLNRQQAWRIAALWTLALIAYSNSFQGGMVFDNATAILKDPRVHAVNGQNLQLILNEEYWYNSSTTGLYRPLTTFSYLVNYAVLGNGPNPAGYHLFNFLVHAANILLVYLLGLALLEDDTWALALAGLWGVHPLLTEAVTNIVGRADLMAAFGVLAGLLCHIRASGAAGRRRRIWLAGLAASAAIGIFSKEAAAVLPAVMLLYDLTWPKRAPWRRRFAGYAAMALPFAVFFALRAELHAHLPVGLIPYADNPLFGYDFWTARLTAVKIIAKYVGLFFWPVRQSADYSYNSIPAGGSWIAIAVCVAGLAGLVLSYRRCKPLFFFLAFFFGTLTPTSNLLLLIGSVMAERFVYLPAVGLAGCVAALASRLPRRRESLAATGAICLALAAATYLRNPVWHDDIGLWTSVAEAYPDNFKAHTTLAEQFAGRSQIDRAVAEADRSLEILSALPDEHNTPRPFATAAMCYRLKGDFRKAVTALEHGLKVEALEIVQIRQINAEHGKRVKPAGWPPLYVELARTFQEGGQWDRGAIVLMEAIEDGNTSPLLSSELVALYQKSAPDSCAVRVSGATASIDANCPLVHAHLCAAAQLLPAPRSASVRQSFGCQ
jgi:protein O-mannosyl-transferase